MDSVLAALLSSIAGLAGGWLALSKRLNADLAYGFTAGALIGLAAFSLMPEVVELNNNAELSILLVAALGALGFLSIYLAEKSLALHHPPEGKPKTGVRPIAGVVSAGVLIAHSFVDGLSIGVAFQVSSAVGLAVAFAVIAHRFVDGFNIANLVIGSGSSRRSGLKLVVLGALAPLLGVGASLFLDISATALLAFLAFFTGLIIYIGASSIHTQTQARPVKGAVILSTLAGLVFMYIVSQLA